MRQVYESKFGVLTAILSISFSPPPSCVLNVSELYTQLIVISREGLSLMWRMQRLGAGGFCPSDYATFRSTADRSDATQ